MQIYKFYFKITKTSGIFCCFVDFLVLDGAKVIKVFKVFKDIKDLSMKRSCARP